jgi:ribulose-phosphate 3-epimerase
MLRDFQKPPMIGLDGGITRLNIAEIAAMGADVIVTGSAIFDGKEPAENIAYMNSILKKT